MLFGDFVSAFISSRGDTDAELERLRGLLKAAYKEQRDLITDNMLGRTRARAEIRVANSEAEYLRGKLIELRPYLVAFAKGPSLQAKRDLQALDAALRATE